MGLETKDRAVFWRSANPLPFCFDQKKPEPSASSLVHKVHQTSDHQREAFSKSCDLEAPTQVGTLEAYPALQYLRGKAPASKAAPEEEGYGKSVSNSSKAGTEDVSCGLEVRPCPLFYRPRCLRRQWFSTNLTREEPPMSTR